MTRKKPVVEPPKPPEQQMIYLGPTLSGGRLAQNAVYRGGVPTQYSYLFEIEPELGLLIVPVESLVETRKKIEELGTPENAVYERLMKGV